MSLCCISKCIYNKEIKQIFCTLHLNTIKRCNQCKTYIDTYHCKLCDEHLSIDIPSCVDCSSKLKNVKTQINIKSNHHHHNRTKICKIHGHCIELCKNYQSFCQKCLSCSPHFEIDHCTKTLECTDPHSIFMHCLQKLCDKHSPYPHCSTCNQHLDFAHCTSLDKNCPTPHSQHPHCMIEKCPYPHSTYSHYCSEPGCTIIHFNHEHF